MLRALTAKGKEINLATINLAKPVEAQDKCRYCTTIQLSAITAKGRVTNLVIMSLVRRVKVLVSPLQVFSSSNRMDYNE